MISIGKVYINVCNTLLPLGAAVLALHETAMKVMAIWNSVSFSFTPYLQAACYLYMALWMIRLASEAIRELYKAAQAYMKPEQPSFWKWAAIKL